MVFTEQKIKELNTYFKKETPLAIAKWAVDQSSRVVVTTNFRPFEASILSVCVQAKKNIPVIWCDSGYNTPQTYKHANELIELLKLQIDLYTPKQTAAYRDVVMGIPSVEDPLHATFTEQVKLEPFRRAMEAHQPEIWFTNLRKGQTKLRDSLDILSVGSDGILKVSPFYHYDDQALEAYLKEHNLPSEHKYFDPTKALANRECGIHIS